MNRSLSDWMIYLHFSRAFTNSQLLRYLSSERIKNGHPLPDAPLKNLQQFHSFEQQHPYESILSSFDLYNEIPLTIIDSRYPLRLREIHDPPVVLYAKGCIDYLTHDYLLGVVGARQADQYTRDTLSAFLPSLIDHKIVIVSGMAAGADQMAHTLSMKGKTIGVLGSGFLHPYPKHSDDLFHAMEQKQLLVTEYPRTASPQKHHFPMRNRIIAGLSTGILVTQAAERSGSMITVDRGLEEGRDIFSVPGNIHHPLSAGTNRLIRMGAIPVYDPAHILMEWNVKSQT